MPLHHAIRDIINCQDDKITSSKQEFLLAASFFKVLTIGGETLLEFYQRIFAYDADASETGVEFLLAIGAETVAENGLGSAADVDLDCVPETLIVADLLAVAAYGDNTLQGFDFSKTRLKLQILESKRQVPLHQPLHAKHHSLDERRIAVLPRIQNAKRAEDFSIRLQDGEAHIGIHAKLDVRVAVPFRILPRVGHQQLLARIDHALAVQTRSGQMLPVAGIVRIALRLT